MSGLSKIIDIQVVDDLAELRSLFPSGTSKLKRVDKDFRILKEIDNYPPITYQYFEALDIDEQLPGIVKPDDTIGNWIMLGTILLEATAIPTEAPIFANSRLIVTLNTPDRVVVYNCDRLSSPAVVSDWVPENKIHYITTNPTFAPDYLGQIVANTSNDSVFVGAGIAASAASWTQIN